MSSVKIKYFIKAIKSVMDLEEDIHGIRYIYSRSNGLKTEIDDYCFLRDIKIERTNELLPHYWDLSAVHRQAERKIMYGGK